MTAAGRHHTSSNTSDCLALEVIFRTEIEKDPWHDVLPLEERGKEVVRNMCNNRALRNRVRQCISEPWSKRKRASRDMLFKMLGYGILLSRNGVAIGINGVERGKEVAFVQRQLLKNVTGKNELYMS